MAPLMTIALGGAVLMAGDSAAANASAPPDQPGFDRTMPRAPDPEAATRSEFARIEAQGTPEAYALFARRHPGHPLAEEAARRAAALRAKGL